MQTIAFNRPKYYKVAVLFRHIQVCHPEENLNCMPLLQKNNPLPDDSTCETIWYNPCNFTNQNFYLKDTDVRKIIRKRN